MAEADLGTTGFDGGFPFNIFAGFTFLGFMLDYRVLLGLSAVGRDWCGRSRYRRTTRVTRRRGERVCANPYRKRSREC